MKQILFTTALMLFAASLVSACVSQPKPESQTEGKAFKTKAECIDNALRPVRRSKVRAHAARKQRELVRCEESFGKSDNQ